jgi:hypothetical protein
MSKTWIVTTPPLESENLKFVDPLKGLGNVPNSGPDLPCLLVPPSTPSPRG